MPAGDLVGQGDDLTPDHGARHQVADCHAGQQHPEVPLTVRQGAKPTMLTKPLQLGQAQLPQPGTVEPAGGVNAERRLPKTAGRKIPTRPAR